MGVSTRPGLETESATSMCARACADEPSLIHGIHFEAYAMTCKLSCLCINCSSRNRCDRAPPPPPPACVEGQGHRSEAFVEVTAAARHDCGERAGARPPRLSGLGDGKASPAEPKPGSGVAPAGFLGDARGVSACVASPSARTGAAQGLAKL